MTWASRSHNPQNGWRSRGEVAQINCLIPITLTRDGNHEGALIWDGESSPENENASGAQPDLEHSRKGQHARGISPVTTGAWTTCCIYRTISTPEAYRRVKPGRGLHADCIALLLLNAFYTTPTAHSRCFLHGVVCYLFFTHTVLYNILTTWRCKVRKCQNISVRQSLHVGVL